MNKTKIDWADMTFNPITGCLHGCEYCYARKIAKRFSTWCFLQGNRPIAKSNDVMGGLLHDLEKPYTKDFPDNKGPVDPYPFGFEPTFHRYRLNEPQKIKKPQNIFVCSMADLFGDWVPGDWIEEVFRACEDAPQHKYLFLTKNPKWLRYPFHQYFNNKNWWIGTTITSNSDSQRVDDLIQETTQKTNRFLSIEPLLGEINLRSWLMSPGWMPIYNNPDNCNGDQPSEPTNEYINWVIIGQQTGPGAVPPKDEWVQSIIEQCRAAGVPVFVKSPLYKKFPIQQWPEGLI